MTDLSTTQNLTGMARSGMVYDNAQGILYLVTTSGLLERWSVQTQSFLSSTQLTGAFQDMDVSTDGSQLLLTRTDMSGSTGYIDRVSTADLSSTVLSFQNAVGEAGPAYISALQNNTAIFTTDLSGSGTTPLRTFPVTGSIGTATVPQATSLPSGGRLIDSLDHRYALYIDTKFTPGTFAIFDSQTSKMVLVNPNTLGAGDSGGNFGAGAINSSVQEAVTVGTTGVFVWNFNGALVKNLASSLGGDTTTAVSFTKDGHQLLVWDTTQHELLAYDTATWSQVGSLAIASQQGFPDTDMSSDGRFLFLHTLQNNGQVGFGVVDLAAELQLTVNGDSNANDLYGSVGNDTLSGLDGNDTLNGGTGNDTLDGGNGTDTVSYSGILYQSGVHVDLTISGPQDTGGGGIDTLISIENLTGSSYDDTLIGDANNNVLDGGPGNDTLDGGGGVNTATYVDAVSGVTVNLSNSAPQDTGGAGIDTLANIQNLIGSPFNDTLEGSSADNVLDGGAGVNTLSYAHAGAGVTVNLSLTTSQDTVGSGHDTVLNFQNVIGSAFDDVLSGTSGDNILIGGAGNDTMIGGAGNDTYEVTDAGDTVVENPGEGTDTVYSYVDGYVLAANVEVLIMEGSDHHVTGNSGDNTIIGTSGDDVIAGGAGNDILLGEGGNDTLIGGTGDDTYEVTEAGDVVVENPGEGTDTVYSYVDGYALTANVETLIMEGSDHHGVGNSGDNTIVGTAGDDVIIGGAGNDTMIGGAGNDTYEVTDAGDNVVENANAGNDTVYSYVDNYVLAANVETLIMEGNDHHAVGNALANTIVGTNGDDVIIGGAGADIMAGGAGNDAYEVDNISDAVIENPGGGNDTVYAYADGYVLAANVEVLIMEGNDHHGIGNSADNTIIGTTGDDVIIGGAGNDLMVGGAGNDTYEVTDAGDNVVENANEGSDTVYSYIDGYALTANVETLVMEGNDHHGVGNALDNTIVGTSGDDVIIGGAGNDTMAGGAGNDAYEVTEAGDQVIEGVNAGSDTIYSYVDGYVLPANVETLVMAGNDHNGVGNALDNYIYGGSGNDAITGGLGNDTLFGGAGSDNFLFTKGDGNDTIMDFTPQAGGDIISLHGYGVAAYAALTPLMSQVGSDVVITFDANNHLTLHGLLLNQLNSGDFTFG